VTADDIREAIEEPVEAIIDPVKRALEKLPRNLSRPQRFGMVLTEAELFSGDWTNA
jgi:actin-like ATPase involved in cell morphogenesis